MARAELIYDNKVWIDMIRKLLVKKEKSRRNGQKMYAPLLLL